MVKDCFSKSLIILTNLLSVDDYGLNPSSFMGILVLDKFNTSPDHLSSFIEFVSLSLFPVCPSVLIGRIASRACPISTIFHVLSYF